MNLSMRKDDCIRNRHILRDIPFLLESLSLPLFPLYTGPQHTNAPLEGDHSIPGAEQRRCSPGGRRKTTEIMLNQAVSLPPEWNGLLEAELLQHRQQASGVAEIAREAASRYTASLLQSRCASRGMILLLWLVASLLMYSLYTTEEYSSRLLKLI